MLRDTPPRLGFLDEQMSRSIIFRDVFQHADLPTGEHLAKRAEYLEN